MLVTINIPAELPAGWDEPAAPKGDTNPIWKNLWHPSATEMPTVSLGDVHSLREEGPWDSLVCRSGAVRRRLGKDRGSPSSDCMEGTGQAERPLHAERRAGWETEGNGEKSH